MKRVIYTRCSDTLGFDTRADRRGVHVAATAVDGTEALYWAVVTGTWHAAV